MILTGAEIHRAWREGELTIDPFSPQRLNPNSYNYRLGDTIVELSAQATGRQMSRHRPLPMAGFILSPSKVYLGHTREVIGSHRYVTTLLGRSSTGRLGLFLNITADLGHLGTAGQWTLELTVVQPLRVYPGMTIGQAAFWESTGKTRLYRGRYYGDVGPVQSRDPGLGAHQLVESGQ